jgi:uncharacterized membrane protein HdeD (DUF308 family)
MCAASPDPGLSQLTRPRDRSEVAFAMTTHVPRPQTHDVWKPTLVSGALAVVVGSVVLLWPHISTEVTAILFGVYLVASAAMQVIIGFSLGERTRGQALLFVSGATSLALGTLAFRDLSHAVQLLAIAIGVAFLFRGMATMVYGITESDAIDGGWTIFFGTITAVAGVILMALPFASMTTLATVVGICLVVLGGLEIISAYKIYVSERELSEPNVGTTDPS